MKKVLLYLPFAFIFFSVHAQTDNETLGTGAGTSITTGDYNIMLGDYAGNKLTSGSYNAMLGPYSGFNQVSASDNVFIGWQSGWTNLSGTDNTFVGKRSGYFNNATDGTFVGTDAGFNNTTGFDNTFIGEKAGFRVTTGGDNTFVGQSAGASYGSSSNDGSPAATTDPATGSDNTAIGSQAGFRLTSGFKNTFLGNDAGWDVTTGFRNTFVGDSAGIDVGVGHHNTFIGQAAGSCTEHANYNTFIGSYSGWDNNRTNSTTNANRNTYVGFRTGYTNREGEDNVGMGAFSNFNNTVRARTTFIGAAINVENNDLIIIGYKGSSNGLYSVGIGNEIDVDNSANSVIIGYKSKATNASNNSVAIGALDTISGANSIVIGYNANVSGSNSIAIGNQASVTADNEVYVGNASTSSIGGVVNWTAASDGRFKTGITENVPGLDFIDLLRPVTYHFDSNKMFRFNGVNPDNEMESSIQQKDETVYTGFVAQEVATAAKASGFDFSGVKVPLDPEKEMYGLRYAEFVVPLVKATQELHRKIQEQDQIIADQQTEINDYKEALLNLSQRLEVLETNYQMEKSTAGMTAKK